MIDLRCPECNYIWEDFLLRAGMRPLPFTCPICRQKTLDKVMLKPPSVHGDEIDVTINNGLCDADGEPVRYRSKTEIKRAAKEKGLVQWVEHKGTKGGDKSKVTQRFI